MSANATADGFFTRSIGDVQLDQFDVAQGLARSSRGVITRREERQDVLGGSGQLAIRSSGVGRVHGLGMAYQRVDLDIGDQSGVSIVH